MQQLIVKLIWLAAVMISCMAASSDESKADKLARPSLGDMWRNYDSSGSPLHPAFMRWEEYADIYQRNLEKYKLREEITVGDEQQKRDNRRVTMLEIGVQSGGSTVVWNNWFKDVKDFLYVGADVNPLCMQLEDLVNSDVEKEKGGDGDSRGRIRIETGSQEDPTFLMYLCNTYGPFDIIIDDGGHTASQVMTSLRTLYPCVVDSGYYFIEDTHTMASYPEEEALFEGKTVAEHIGLIYESMHSHWSVKKFAKNEFSKRRDINYDPVFSNTVRSIELVDSMVVFQKKDDKVQPLTPMVRGTLRIPYFSSPTINIMLVGPDGLLDTKPFSTFIATSSVTFTNDEKRRVFQECIVFCKNYFGNISWCPMTVMNKAIDYAFQTSIEKLPDLYAFDVGDDP